MTFVVRISPRPPFGTDKEELLALGKGLAQDIRGLSNVEDAESSEVIEKSFIAEPSVIVTALFTGLITNAAYDALKALIGLLKKKLKNREFEAYSIEINNTHYHLGPDTLTTVEREILKQISEAAPHKKIVKRPISKANPPGKRQKRKRPPRSDG